MFLHRLYARATVLAAQGVPAEPAHAELLALAGGDVALLREAAEHAHAVAFVVDGHPVARRAAELLADTIAPPHPVAAA